MTPYEEQKFLKEFSLGKNRKYLRKRTYIHNKEAKAWHIHCSSVPAAPQNYVRSGLMSNRDSNLPQWVLCNESVSETEFLLKASWDGFYDISMGAY